MACCWEGLKSIWRGAPGQDSGDREEFEQRVLFLSSVPLFRKQLPKAQLPKLAQEFVPRIWEPGQRLVRQGDMGGALFLIMSGEAQVVTCRDPSEPECVRTTLFAGDYFGGHTLITERANVATIVASGSSRLVTLSLSRDRFDALGLRRWLQFPKRPGIYTDASTPPHLSSREDLQLLPSEDVTFLCKAMCENANLRALLAANEEKLQEVAAGSRPRIFSKGDTIATSGELAHELFIVASGSVEAIADDHCRGHGLSAETAVANSTMADRFLRKQTFLSQLCLQRRASTTASMFVASPAVTENPRRRLSAVNFASPRQAENGQAQFSRKPSPEADRQVTFSLIVADRSPSPEASRQGTPQIEMPQVETGVLSRGDSFGELSLLYNMPLHATFRARDDCRIYVIERRHFSACFNRKGRRFNEYCKLLEEVHILSPLLSSEMWELACNATGLVDFQPGERVLHQGRVRTARRWYIVFSGTAVVSLDQETNGQQENVQLAILSRAGHFGERSLLRGDAACPVNVDAGPDGMCCLTFDGGSIVPILQKVLQQENSVGPSAYCDIKDWWSRKARGFRVEDDVVESSLPIVWDRLESNCEVELDELTKVCLLGRGGYGQVSLVEDRSKLKRYALKTLSKGHIQKQGAQRLVSWERELLTLCDSPFVIRLHRTFKDSQHVHFLLEAALGGSLLQVLRDNPEILSQDNPRGASAAFYIACIAAALEHLHDRHIVHRDVKPENALLDEQGYAKLCDLGFARFVLGKTNTLAGTPDYMAPEMIDFPHTHTHTVDWWALGVTSYELLAGQTPFTDEGISDPMSRLLAIRRGQEQVISFPFHFPQAAKGFVKQLLCLKPQERLGACGAHEIREHAMYSRALNFNFAALIAQTLASPFQNAWDDSGICASDDLGMDRGELGLHATDSIFIECPEETDGWDANF